MIIIRRLLVLLIIIIIIVCCGIVTNANGNKSYKCEITHISSTGWVKSNSIAINTLF